MRANSAGLLQRVVWSLPWLARYPFWRAQRLLEDWTAQRGPFHLILLVANHFEPGWNDDGTVADLPTQRMRLDGWCDRAEAIGRAVRDHDLTPYRHTYFYPAEQYHRSLVERLVALQKDGFGEVEIHLHHGVDRPDTPENLRRVLTNFRDALAEEHGCLSRHDGSPHPRYAFVHGNLALGNSEGGKFCGVDSELQILAETGCYADFTLPSAPNQSQVPRINAIYECGRPLHEPRAHRSGPGLRVGAPPRSPVIFTGPLVLDWGRRVFGVPVPRVDDGVLGSSYTPSISRLERWMNAGISIKGRPDWVFVKLYCHGFFTFDQPAMIGEPMRVFLEDLFNLADRTGSFKVHFASARESFNMVMAAVEGRSGEPGQYRDYHLQSIMRTGGSRSAAPLEPATRPLRQSNRDQADGRDQWHGMSGARRNRQNVG